MSTTTQTTTTFGDSLKKRRPDYETPKAVPEEVAGFVRTLFTLLQVCDPHIVSWSDDGTAMLIHDPARFAGEVCPKFFRHRNFNSFTRLLNMYQFHKVPSSGRDKAVVFVHPCFKRDSEASLSKIQRKGAAANPDKKKDDPQPKKQRLNPVEAPPKVVKEEPKPVPPRPNPPSEAQKRPPAEKKKSGDNKKRAPSMFPSTAHYRAAAGTPEALIGRDVWERTNAEINELEKKSGFLSQSTVGGSSAVSTWMRRVVELEKESRRLKAENDRLKTVEVELDGLRSQLQLQQDYITQLQVAGLQQQSPPRSTEGGGGGGEDPVEKMTAALLAAGGGGPEDAMATTFYSAAMPGVWQQMINSAAADENPAPLVVPPENNNNTQQQDDPDAALKALLGKLPPLTQEQQQNPSDDAVAAANAILADPSMMHLFLQCIQKDQPPTSDLSTSPFQTQCLAQCFASCGQLPSSV